MNKSLEDEKSSISWILVAAIFACITTLLFLCSIICSFRSLKLAIDVIDASADFIRDHKRVIGVPVLYFVFTMTFLVLWLASMTFVISENTIEAGKFPMDKNLIWKTSVKYKTWWMLFCALWIISWLKYSSNFIIMVTATTHYFNCTQENGRQGEGDLGVAFRMTYMNHTGSIAFGALIIAIVRFIRFVFLYLSEKAAEASGENPVVKGIIACGNCCLGCIEKICDYLNNLAFAYMAVSGENFCKSAWNGFLLNLKHL